MRSLKSHTPFGAPEPSEPRAFGPRQVAQVLGEDRAERRIRAVDPAARGHPVSHVHLRDYPHTTFSFPLAWIGGVEVRGVVAHFLYKNHRFKP